ncbi:IS5 family transposase [Saccharothrix australiensis]|uniref:DDE family transposase n=1 Tax=Saccharothrix australiensis TaxID=2072 RepID=A0A495VU00_9PSEU|nr:IS5 family transposase [Saccharothrix australiensis]RKT52802.1 DDE family transposase [Saccharothrix australiensis]
MRSAGPWRRGTWSAGWCSRCRWEKHCRRLIVDAIFYVVDNGIKWRALPADFPPWLAVYKRFALWEKVGAAQRLLDALRDRVRLAEGRVAAPSAAVMDSQSVRTAATVGRATRSWDGGTKVAGRKRHIVVDTPDLLVAVLVTPASTQDRVAARSLLRRLRDTAGKRAAALVWADGGHTGPLLNRARTTLGRVVRIVQRPQVPYFTVLPRRWVVERSLARITGHRRCVRDHERHHHEAMVRWSMTPASGQGARTSAGRPTMADRSGPL